jgi:hypothetical protein
MGSADPPIEGALRLVEEDVGVLALLAAAGGAAALAARRGRRSALAVLLVVAAGDLAYAVFLNPMGIEERQTGTPLLVALAVLAGAGVAAAGRTVGRLGPIAAGALALVVSIHPLLAGGGAKRAARDSDVMRLWAETALSATPPRAVALLREDSTLSAGFWLTLVEPVRPDVAVLARQHLWDVERDRAVLARAGTRLEATDAAGARRAIVAGDRPVVWELGDDPLPAGVPSAMGVPLLSLGKRAAPPLPDLDRIFTAAAVADPPAAAVAAKAYNNLAVLVAHAGDRARAAGLAERAVDLHPEPLGLVNAARFRLALGQDGLALRHLEEAARLAPGRAAVWSLLGTLRAREGRCRDARLLLERALRLDPGDEDAKVNLGLLGGCVEGKAPR